LQSALEEKNRVIICEWGVEEEVTRRKAASDKD